MSDINNVITKSIFDKINILDQLSEKSLVFSKDEKNKIKEFLGLIRKRIDKIVNTPLKVGLLGGSGVGKSTMINYIAESVISKQSHTRPYTGKIIVYKHEKMPAEFLNNFENKKIVDHKEDKIKHIIIFDLPDIDSIITDHREMVQNFASELDIILCVVSPEKYSDRSLFNLLKIIYKSKNNIFFVMNKIDLLTENQLAQITGSFNMLLQDASYIGASIFMISTKQAIENINSTGSNGMLQLKEWLLAKRKEKEIVKIKSDNINEELNSFVQNIENNLNKEKVESFALKINEVWEKLNLFEKQLNKQIIFIIDQEIFSDIFNSILNQQILLWPVYMMTTFIKHFDLKYDNLCHSIDIHSLKSTLKTIDNELLCEANDIKGKKVNINFSKIFNDFINENKNIENIIQYLSKVNPLKKMFFVIKQCLFIFFPIFLYIIYLSEIRNINQLIELYHPLNFLYAFFIVLLKIFSTEGFVGLISLFIIEIWICIYLAHCRNKSIKKQTDKIFIDINKKANQILIARLKQHHLDLKNNVEQLSNEISIITKL